MPGPGSRPGRLRLIVRERAELRLRAAASAGRGPVRAVAAELLAVGLDVRAVVLVEGVSDRLALLQLATGRGRDLRADGVEVVAMGGATNIGHFLELFGPGGLDVELAGLCDERQAGDFRRGLERAGLGAAGALPPGFFVCVADLEDELIRSLGPPRVEAVVERAGETALWRSFQRQPEWRGRPVQQQLRRFMGTRSGRKERYATLLVDALDLAHVPAPLESVLAGL